MRTKRPLSAPGTRNEISTAEKLTSVVNKNTLPATSPRIPAQKSKPNKLRPHTSHHANLYSPRTPSTNARSGIRESLVPTPVNISNQGIQNLRVQREFLSWFCQAAQNETRVYLWIYLLTTVEILSAICCAVVSYFDRTNVEGISCCLSPKKEF